MSRKAWMLSRILQEFKNTFLKLEVKLRSTLEAIRFEFWMKGTPVTVEICALCGW